MFCPNCGHQNDENAVFCESCGSSMEQPVKSPVLNTAQRERVKDSSVISVGGYLGMMFLGVIPLVGFVLFIIWSFSSNVNQNKKNWARATLIFAVVFMVISIIFYIIVFQSIMSLYSY